MEDCAYGTEKLRVKAERFQRTRKLWKSEAQGKVRRRTTLGIIQYTLICATRRTVIQFGCQESRIERFPLPLKRDALIHFSGKICDFKLNDLLTHTFLFIGVKL